METQRTWRSQLPKQVWNWKQEDSTEEIQEKWQRHRAMVRLGQVWWGYKVNHSSINSTTITRNFYFFEDCIYFVEAIFLDIIFDLFSRILNYFEDEVSLRQFILKTVYPGTVYPQDSLSSRQFILKTVYPQAELSLRINSFEDKLSEDKLSWG